MIKNYFNLKNIVLLIKNYFNLSLKLRFSYFKFFICWNLVRFACPLTDNLLKICYCAVCARSSYDRGVCSVYDRCMIGVCSVCVRCARAVSALYARCMRDICAVCVRGVCIDFYFSSTKSIVIYLFSFYHLRSFKVH